MTEKSESPDEEMRRKYREAIEAKRSGHGNAAGGKSSGKALGATASMNSQRMFRRKSG